MSAAAAQAARATAADWASSSLAQENPSPHVHQSMPSWLQTFPSPVRHWPDVVNCTTPQSHPRAMPRVSLPKAAVDFPLLLRVLTITFEDTRRRAGGE